MNDRNAAVIFVQQKLRSFIGAGHIIYKYTVTFQTADITVDQYNRDIHFLNILQQFYTFLRCLHYRRDDQTPDTVFNN